MNCPLVFFLVFEKQPLLALPPQIAKMKIHSYLKVALALLIPATASAQKINYTEFDLKNGLHVILHEDHSTPIVAVTVMYHVGSKNETTGRSGMAHFFEHLLFEGSDNIVVENTPAT